MDWLFVAKEVFGWLIPIVLTGFVAVYITPFRRALKRGQQELQKEEWKELSKPLTNDLKEMQECHSEDKKELEQRIATLEQRDEEIKHRLDLILTTVQNSDIKNTKAFIDIYQRDLIVDGKTYIEHGFITPHQLANYKKRYDQYKALGGNGDVEPWMEKIKKLEVRFPNNFNYTIEQ